MKRFITIVVVVFIALGFAVPVIGANIGPVIGSNPSSLDFGEAQSGLVTELIISVVNADDNSFLLEGAVFSLYTTEQPTDDYGDPLTGITTREHEGETLYLISDSLESNEFGIVRLLGENNDYDIMIGAGTFYLFETAAPYGYYRLYGPIRFTVVPTIEGNSLLGLELESPNASFTYSYQTDIISMVVEYYSGEWFFPPRRQFLSINSLLVSGVWVFLIAMFLLALKEGKKQ